MLTPAQKQKVRTTITNFCLRAEQNQLRWHYSQQRPYHGLNVAPEDWHVADCSAYVALVYNWTMHHTAIYLADPLGENYSGYGYTDTQLEWLRRHGTPAPDGKYLVGDMVIYGHSDWNTTHTAICRKAGGDTTALWSSHGNENGPQAVRLHYHPDPVVGIYRHPALR